jgi:hypothetical protein
MQVQDIKVKQHLNEHKNKFKNESKKSKRMKQRMNTRAKEKGKNGPRRKETINGRESKGRMRKNIWRKEIKVRKGERLKRAGNKRK